VPCTVKESMTGSLFAGGVGGSGGAGVVGVPPQPASTAAASASAADLVLPVMGPLALREAPREGARHRTGARAIGGRVGTGSRELAVAQLPGLDVGVIVGRDVVDAVDDLDVLVREDRRFPVRRHSAAGVAPLDTAGDRTERVAERHGRRRRADDGL